MHRRSASLLFVLLTQAAAVITTDTAGEPIGFPADIGTRSGTTVTVALRLAQHTYVGVGCVQETRAFNGEVPGPTIRVKPGDTLVLELHNDLSADAYDTSSLHNEFKVGPPTCRARALPRACPLSLHSLGYAPPLAAFVLRDFETTNLHTHGMHISGESPGDNIFITVAPSAVNTYTYVIPADHMGGTFW